MSPIKATALLIAGASVAPFVYAQADDTDESVQILGTVVVEGRERVVTETAAAITTIDGETIESIAALRLGDVLADVPGVFFSGLNGPRETPQIRNTLSFDNRTLFLEDGVPLQSSVFFDQSALGYSTALASPGGVDVLRGPGSVLHGSDAFTGVIHVRSQDLSDELTGNLRARGGEFGLYDVAGSLNAPLGPNQQLRVTAAIAGEDGFRDETTFRRAHGMVRHGWQSDNWQTDSLFTFTDSFTESATSIPFADFEAGNVFGSGLNPQVDPEEAEEDVQYYRAQSKVTYTGFENLTLEVTPYYRSQNVAGTLTFQPATTPRETADVDTFGTLARGYYDHADGATTIFGVDLEFTNLDLELFQSRPDATVFGNVFLQGPQFDYEVDFQAYSPYIQHEREVLPGLTLTAGLRYDRLRYNFSNNLTDVPGDARLQVADRVDTFDAFSPKARLLWQVTDTQQLFARYARGFRTPRASELYELEDGQAEFVLEPETFDSGEIGWRGEFVLNGLDLSTELIGYYQVSRDGVVTDVQTAAGNISVNAGERRFAGIEFALSADLPYGFDTQLAFAWQDFIFRQFGAQPGSPFDGNQIEEAPRTIGNLTVNWTPPFYERATVSARLRHLGSWPLNSGNTLFTDDEFILTLLGEWRVTENVALELRLENVTDNNYAVFADAPFFAPNGRARPGQPFTVSGGIRLGF